MAPAPWRGAGCPRLLVAPGPGAAPRVPPSLGPALSLTPVTSQRWTLSQTPVSSVSLPSSLGLAASPRYLCFLELASSLTLPTPRAATFSRRRRFPLSPASVRGLMSSLARGTSLRPPSARLLALCPPNSPPPWPRGPAAPDSVCGEVARSVCGEVAHLRPSWARRAAAWPVQGPSCPSLALPPAAPGWGPGQPPPPAASACAPAAS